MSKEKEAIKISVYDGTTLILEKSFHEFPISFGRNSSNLVQLDFNFVSRAHCSLVEDRGRVFLVDLESSCGIAIEGQPVHRVNVDGAITFTIRTITVKVEVPDEYQKTNPGIKKTVEPISIPQMPRKPEGAPTVLDEDYKPSRFQAEKSSATSHPVPKMPPRAPTARVDKTPAPATENGYEPVIRNDFRGQLIGIHPELAKASYRKIEAIVSWHDVIYDVRQFHENEPITIGGLGHSVLPIPIFKQNITIARVGRQKTICFALRDHTISMNSDNTPLSSHDMMAKNILEPKGPGYSWSMNHKDVSTIDFGSGVCVHLRYVPGTKPLSRVPLLEPDAAIKKSLVGSFILHCALALMVFVGAPPAKHGPKLKNVPDRYARLLIEKPKPTPAPTPPPKKEEIVKKEPPKPKKVVERKPVKITKQPKVLAKRNKYPIEVEHPMPKAPPPVKVEALGALGALGAISKNAAPTEVPTNININENAGGLPSKAINTGGIVGALPSTNGKLAAAGSGRVKTKGLGYGTGTGYGIKGLRGLAGQRAVAGAVVGAPKLATFNEKQEGLTRAQVMEKLKAYMAEVQHCYEKNLLSNPDLAGRVDFEWDIAPSGKVTDVRVKRSTVNGGDTLVGCVKNVFFSISFPKAKNGMITTPTIGFPFGRI